MHTPANGTSPALVLRRAAVYSPRKGLRGLSSGKRGDEELERLVVAVAAGDEAAWQDLWNALEPRLAAVLRNGTFVGHRGRRDDDGRDVLVAIMGRLREDQFRRLRLYLEARRRAPGMTFMRWLIVVAKRIAIDSMRAHPDYVDRRRSAAAAADAPGMWVETIVLPSDNSLSGGRPPMTNRVAARQILRYAAGVLSQQQCQALELWAEHGSCDEIARALDLGGPDEAERVVRAAVERLRRHFRKDPPG